MKLLEYLKQRKLSIRDAANELGVHEGTIRKIAYGQRQPSLSLAIRISEMTNGKVTESDLATPAQSAAA